jgi:hypothetical protein
LDSESSQRRARRLIGIAEVNVGRRRISKNRHRVSRVSNTRVPKANGEQRGANAFTPWSQRKSSSRGASRRVLKMLMTDDKSRSDLAGCVEIDLLLYVVLGW